MSFWPISERFQLRYPDDLPRTAASRLPQLAFMSVTWLLVFSLICPLFPTFPGGLSLDAAWNAALHQAIASGLVFGQDIVATFGPYAGVWTRMYHPGTDNITLLGSAYFAFCYASLLVYAGLRTRKWALILVIALLMVSVAKSRDAHLLLYPALLSLIVISGRSHAWMLECKEREISRGLLALFASPLGFLPLTKGSLLVPSLVAIGVLAIYYTAKRQYGRLPLIVLGPVLSCVVFWALAGQPVSGLPQYFISLGQVTAGYTDAMSGDGPEFHIYIYLLASLSLLVAYAWLNRKDDLLTRGLVLVSVCFVFFIGFKAGFVRHDGHALTAASIVLLMALFVSLISERSSLFAVALAFCCWTVIDAHYLKTSTDQVVAYLRGTYANTVAGARIRLSGKDEFAKVYAERKAALAGQCNLPPVEGSVDIYSYGQGCVLAQGMQWSPRPLFQSHGTYSPALQEMNANHLLGPTAAKTLLFRVEPIDGRFPALEDSLAWPVILNNYDLASYENDMAVFRRRSGKPEATASALMKAGRARLGETVSLPASAAGTYVAFEVTPTLLGRLVSLVYKLPHLKMTTNLAGGASNEFRLVASMARAPFLISPLITSTHDFVKFSEGNPALLAGNQVESFSIRSDMEGSSLLWSDEFSYRLLAIKTRTSAKVSKEVFDVPLVVQPKESTLLPEACDGSLDTLNGTSPAPMAYKTAGNLAVEGWAAVSAAQGVPVDEVYIVLTPSNGVPLFFGTRVRDRSDVGAHFKQPALNNSGYISVIDTGKLSGEFSLGVARKYKGRVELCKPLRSLTITH